MHNVWHTECSVVYQYIQIYIYICRERERCYTLLTGHAHADLGGVRLRGCSPSFGHGAGPGLYLFILYFLFVCGYTYIYIYMYICIYIYIYVDVAPVARVEWFLPGA